MTNLEKLKLQLATKIMVKDYQNNSYEKLLKMSVEELREVLNV